MKTVIEHIHEAYVCTGAPGRVIGYWADGTYAAQLQCFGASDKITRRKISRWNSNGTVSLRVSWSISGSRQRHRGTSTVGVAT